MQCRTSVSADGKGRKVWAAAGVTKLVVAPGQLDDFQVNFALVNDSDTPLDPQVPSWRLLINGKAHPDSQAIFGSGPRDARWKSLPSGEHLSFAYALRDPFKKPGTYTLIWKSDLFASAPTVFRVLPEKK